jgi:hypothetical protein
MKENASQFARALKKVCEWAISMHTEIDFGDKLGFIHSNIRKFPDIDDISLVFSSREKKKLFDKEVKLLGIVLDRRLNFKSHTDGGSGQI